jgi:hypothetical protein
MSLSIEQLRNVKVLRGGEYMEYALSHVAVGEKYLEFGVFKGNSINHIADAIYPKTIFGFDSFEGLPEVWEMGSSDRDKPKGHFNLCGVLPKVRDNVILIKGFFSDTLSKWVESNNEDISFLHIDSDLYSSAKLILNCLNHLIISGTVIVFDDMYPWQDESIYLNWANGEFKAMNEWFNEKKRSAIAISRERNWSSTIIVTK